MGSATVGTAKILGVTWELVGRRVLSGTCVPRQHGGLAGTMQCKGLHRMYLRQAKAAGTLSGMDCLFIHGAKFGRGDGKMLLGRLSPRYETGRYLAEVN